MMPRLKVQIWITHQQQTLLLQTTAERGGFWQPVTGGVESGESLPDAALRELKEEIGIASSMMSQEALSLRDLRRSFQYKKNGFTFEEHVFAVELKTFPQLICLDHREHQRFQWMSENEANEVLTFPIYQQIVRLIF